MLAELLGHKPDALLFDLDGTLVDSVPDIAAAADAMLAELGFAPAGEPQIRQWVGNGALKLVERALADALACREPGVDRTQLNDAHHCFLRHYAASNGRHSRLYPGVRDTLAEWHRQSMPMAVVTNKPIQFVPRLLAGLGIDSYFSLCLGGECVEQKKPHPMMLLETCRRLEVPPERSVLIGDSRNDVEAARAAGMPVVAVSYGYNHGRPVTMENPDALVHDFAALLAARGA